MNISSSRSLKNLVNYDEGSDSDINGKVLRTAEDISSTMILPSLSPTLYSDILKKYNPKNPLGGPQISEICKKHVQMMDSDLTSIMGYASSAFIKPTLSLLKSQKTKCAPATVVKTLQYMQNYARDTYYFANGIYTHNTHLERIHFGQKCPITDKLNLGFQPSGYIVYDPNVSAVIIAFRGTWNLGDVIGADMDYKQVKLDPVLFPNIRSDCKVMEGFHSYYLKVAEEIKNVVGYFLKKYQSPKNHIRVVGHSLGGALATLCALHLHGLSPYNSIFSCADELKCFTYGAPRAGNKAFCGVVDSKFSNGQRIYRVVTGADIITFVPRRYTDENSLVEDRNYWNHPGVEYFINNYEQTLKCEKTAMECSCGRISPKVLKCFDTRPSNTFGLLLNGISHSYYLAYHLLGYYHTFLPFDFLHFLKHMEIEVPLVGLGVKIDITFESYFSRYLHHCYTKNEGLLLKF